MLSNSTACAIKFKQQNSADHAIISAVKRHANFAVGLVFIVNKEVCAGQGDWLAGERCAGR